MKIGFCVSREGSIWANALTGASSLKELRKETKEAGAVETALTLLDFTNLSTESRGDMSDAFAALRLLIGVNHFNPGSLCYAVEEMLEGVFEAGRAYERTLKGGVEGSAISTGLYDLLDRSIEELDLPPRPYNALKAVGIETISNLIQWKESSKRPHGILSILNFGRKSLNQTKEALRALGLTFGMKIKHERGIYILYRPNGDMITSLSQLQFSEE